VEFFACIRASHEDEALRNMVKKAYEEMQETYPSHSYVNEYGKIIFTGNGDRPCCRPE